jgi:phage terminase small subunit
MAAGSTKPRSGTAERRQAFVQAYIANGHNAIKAAISAGYSARTAYSQGQRLLKNVEIRGELANVAQQVAKVVGLETQRTLQECARLVYSDIGAFLNDDGSLKPRSEWTPEMSACVASVEFDRTTGRPVRIKLWDKNAALMAAMKHHGLFREDNGQKGDSVEVRVLLVGPP